MSKTCTICSALLISAMGHSEDLLIIGDAPHKEDIEKGRPFSISHFYTTAGQVLRKELERVGLSFMDFRVMNLWMHEPNNSEECWQLGYDTVLSEAKGKKAILLVGADVVETFTNYKVSDVSGLRVESAILSAPLLVAMVSPAMAMTRGVGEVRFAIGRWKYWLEKEKMI